MMYQKHIERRPETNMNSTQSDIEFNGISPVFNVTDVTNAQRAKNQYFLKNFIKIVV